MTLSIPKSKFDDFLKAIMKRNELVAPVKESRFDVIEDVSEIMMDKHARYPAKKFFFRKKETLYTFEKGKITVPEQSKKPRVIIGLKRCDLNSIHRQDIVFFDPYYKSEREKTLLIGYHCKKPADEFCFCFEDKDFFDLMLYDKKDCYLVETGSKKGEKFVKRFKKHFKEKKIAITDKDRKIKTKLKLENKDIGPYYDHSGWKKEVDKCLSCAACVTTCPSCFCFDLYDKTDAKLCRCEKKRNWASCQLTCFTKVAGGHIFREAREARFKHRIYHQMKYFKDVHGINLCTGCGRCIRNCPTKINWVARLNKMKK